MVFLIRGDRRPAIGVQVSRGDVGLGTATGGRRDRLLLRIVAKSSEWRSAPAQHSVHLHAALGQLGLLTDLLLQSKPSPIAGLN